MVDYKKKYGSFGATNFRSSVSIPMVCVVFKAV